MAEIILIQPPLTTKELFARGSFSSASLMPPLGLAYIAGQLERFGHEVRIMDCLAERATIDQVVKTVGDYDFVGITVVSTYAKRACDLIRSLNELNKRPPIIVGGAHVTALPQQMLEAGADYAVIGEGENTVVELVDAITGGRRKVKDVKGVGFLESGKMVLTGRREHINPLDSLPMPARHLLPMHLYFSSIARSANQPSHSMLASRGCPGYCSFCSKKSFGTRIRYFGVDRIVDEFFELRDKYGARDVALWDDNFVTDPDVVMAVCDKLREKAFDLSWSVEARVDAVSRPVLAALKAAGCEYVCYGIESGSQRVLDYVNKRTTKDQIREAIRVTKEEGLHIRGYFMLGLPTETKSEMEETIDFAMELDVDLASFTMFVPLPGTLEYQRAMKTGSFLDPEYYLHKIIPEFNFLEEPLFVPSGMTAAELMQIHRSAYNRYYFRPGPILRRLGGIRSLNDVVAALKGGQTLLTNFLGRIFSDSQRTVL